MGTVMEAEARPNEFRPAKEEVDPELLQLPDPPRGERRSTLIVLAIAAIASAAMAFALTRDAAYALRSTSATDLGDLETATSSTFVSNSYVEGHGRLSGAGRNSVRAAVRERLVPHRADRGQASRRSRGPGE